MDESSAWLPPTRLERIVIALLGSDYVKMPFLEAGELCAMARLIELELDQVRCLDRVEAEQHLEKSRRTANPFNQR